MGQTDGQLPLIKPAPSLFNEFTVHTVHACEDVKCNTLQKSLIVFLIVDFQQIRILEGHPGE